jgi:hypothetical protein
MHAGGPGHPSVVDCRARPCGFCLAGGLQAQWQCRQDLLVDRKRACRTTGLIWHWMKLWG